MKGPTKQILGAGRSFALALLLCLSLGEVYGQSTSGEIPSALGDTLRQYEDSLLFSKPKRLEGLTIMKHTNSHLDTLVNNSIHTQYPDFEIDFIESPDNTITSFIITQHNSQGRNYPNKRYQYSFTFPLSSKDPAIKILPSIEQKIQWIQQQARGKQRPLTTEEIEQWQRMKDEAAKKNIK